ncbi:trypsin-like peptidase domain-containing protein [Streptomyces sp. NPDC051211]|uniref:trypsin-like serine peptidase n=1 Tax=Streptomyces sp. NPDC051211 TaxID=3154643 RepID=UPI00344EA59F
MDRRNVVTGVLCAAAALAASAAMTWVVPPATAGPPAAERSPRPSAPASPTPTRIPSPTPESPSAPTPTPTPSAPTPSPTPPGPGGTAYTGALFEGTLAAGHFCTATVVRSPGRNLIVTAGHCLADGRKGAGPSGGLFAPAYANGNAPYGTWRIEEVFEDPRWSEGGDDAYDLAFARLAPDAQGRNIEDVTGAAPLDTTGRSGEQVTVTGYPSDREVPRTCTSTAVRQSDTELRFDCADFPGGTSGSAWIARDGKIIGVLTGGETDNESTSTVLGRYAAELYTRATAARR